MIEKQINEGSLEAIFTSRRAQRQRKERMESVSGVCCQCGALQPRRRDGSPGCRVGVYDRESDTAFAFCHEGCLGQWQAERGANEQF